MSDVKAPPKPRKVLPPVYFFASLLLMLALHYALPGPRIISGSVRYLGIVLMGAALGFGLWARMLFVQVGTTVKPFQESSELVVQGPFHVTRNPMYLSMVTLLFGLAILLGSLTPFFVIPVFVLIINRRFIPAEESMLEQRFGDSYRNYHQHVRRWI
jgi:protein-S-isoprenylcysteine O-methyltransferase Ste14